MSDIDHDEAKRLAESIIRANADAQDLARAYLDLAERRSDNGCPCLHTTPCDPACTCVTRYSSVGCSRCCRYGSPEQQRARAEILAERAATPAAWVPCAERMPEKRVRVIAAQRDFIVGDCFYGVACLPIKDYQPDNDVERWRYTESERPVPKHMLPDQWTELPTPPRLPPAPPDTTNAAAAAEPPTAARMAAEEGQ